ncbi:MAG TPA: FAD-dependent oxidoreductase [Pyrinomonadaceae bacterium]|nr:FAD-dependent oxidoreductase [Pyrinomonadaceae bacterium]
MIGNLNPSRKEATIVGAGIAGLLAAYSLDRQGYRVALLEEKERAGGLIQTRKTQYGIAESGAHSLIASEAVRRLCSDLGVELLRPRKEAKAKYIVRDGRLRRFPLTIGEAVDTLGHAALARATNRESQTLEVWARRHLGDAALEYLLTPFVRGIYGVQPAELGVATAFPFLNLPAGKTFLGSMLKRHRSGAAKKDKKHRAAPRFGMGDLVGRLEQRLEQRLGSRFRKDVRVDQLPEAANVIIATPAQAAAKIIQSASTTLADKLASVRYTPIVSATVFVDRHAFTRPLHGVGVLMPPREQTKSLGILFNSSSFDCRVCEASRFASFTVMMGGTAQPQWVRASDDEIRQAIKFELAMLLGILEPYEVVIHRWPAALPQYSPELADVWDVARQTWCATPGHILFGNYTGQISLRGMIESATKLVG